MFGQLQLGREHLLYFPLKVRMRFAFLKGGKKTALRQRKKYAAGVVQKRLYSVLYRRFWFHSFCWAFEAALFLYFGLAIFIMCTFGITEFVFTYLYRTIQNSGSKGFLRKRFPLLPNFFMMHLFHHKYQCLLQALEECRQQPSGQTRTIEMSFQICFTAYRELEAEIMAMEWTAKEWTVLNRFVRPLFLSRLEYFTLMYHAAVFCPLRRETAIRFWIQEFIRQDKFCEEHVAFYRYCKSGSDHLDDEYFSCPGTDANDKTCGTVLWAKLLALEEYLPYVKTQLLALGVKESFLSRCRNEGDHMDL